MGPDLVVPQRVSLPVVVRLTDLSRKDGVVRGVVGVPRGVVGPERREIESVRERPAPDVPRDKAPPLFRSGV